MPAKKAHKSSKKGAAKSKKKLGNGSKLVCNECGLILTVDEMCGCDDYCDVICCGEQMSLR
jgi:rubrerythrin